MLDILEIAREDGMTAGMEEGMFKGMRKGIQKGRLEERLEMAKAFKEQGVDINIISHTTGIPLEQVKRL